MLSYEVLEAVLMACFTLVNKTSVINTLVMKDLPKNLYCKNCGKVTPHRPKLDAVINGKLVCNICNIQNDIKP